MAAGHVAVVGAGLAGLAAGLALKERGYTVDLYERSRLLGGKATSFQLDGVEVDNGQHVYLACCTAFLDFVRSLDAQDLLQTQERFDALLLSAGRAPARLRANNLPAPFHLVLALLRYRHLSLANRLRVAMALLAAKRPVDNYETFDHWLRRHGQTEQTRRAFWEPFFVPALNAPLDLVAARSALFVVRTAFLADARAARFGFSRVPLAHIARRAAERLDHVYLRSPVRGLAWAKSEEGAPELQGLHLHDDRLVPYDAVVLAIPPRRLLSLLPDAASLGIHGLDQFETAAIIDVHLWYDPPAAGIGFAALLDSPVQWVFEKAPGYLCCSLSAAGDLISLPREELIALCDRELHVVLPALSGSRLIRGAVTRDRDATFVPAPGLTRPGVTTSCPQVTIAGAWTESEWPATMESAVRSGRQAAEALRLAPARAVVDRG